MTQASTHDQASSQDIDAKKAAAIEELLSIRGSIDNIDAAVIHMLAERFKCTKRVGVLKAENDIPPSDVDREQRQIERLRKLAIDADLDAEFAEKFLNFIIREVIQNHLAMRE